MIIAPMSVDITTAGIHPYGGSRSSHASSPALATIAARHRYASPCGRVLPRNDAAYTKKTDAAGLVGISPSPSARNPPQIHRMRRPRIQ
jgi:hypothetical protein